MLLAMGRGAGGGRAGLLFRRSSNTANRRKGERARQACGATSRGARRRLEHGEEGAGECAEVVGVALGKEVEGADGED